MARVRTTAGRSKIETVRSCGASNTHSDDSHRTGDLLRRVTPSRWTFGDTGMMMHATRTGHTHAGNDISNADLDCDGAGG